MSYYTGLPEQGRESFKTMVKSYTPVITRCILFSSIDSTINYDAYGNHMRYFFLSSIPVLILLKCSPIPLIQSPRITSRFAVSTSIKTSGELNTNRAEPEIRSKKRFVVDEKNPFFITLGFHNRLELSGVVLPYIRYGVIWQGNIKLALFTLGEEQRFRNMAAALFAGTAGYKGEHEDKSNYYAGLSIGSVTRCGPGEVELVVQSSASYEEEIGFEDNGRYTIYWLQPAFGIIYRPEKLRIIELNFGINYSHPIKSDITCITSYYPTTISTRSHNTANGGIAFLGELRFNLVRSPNR